VQPTGQLLGFNNTNRLVASTGWDILVSKTGYIREAGKCLVMLATIASKPFVIVLLDSAGKYTRLGDAERVRYWLETGRSMPVAKAVGKPAKSKVARARCGPRVSCAQHGANPAIARYRKPRSRCRRQRSDGTCGLSGQTDLNPAP
jgi:D-alanyl-D-alanine carboxypeptidase